MNFLVPMTPATTGPQWMPIRKLMPSRAAALDVARPRRRASSAIAATRAGVVVGSLGHAADDHVGVADRLDLLQPVALDEAVEDREDVVQDADQLVRRQRRRQPGELDDVGEQEGHVVEAVGDQRLAVPQPIGDRLGQDVQEQPLVLAGQALRSLTAVMSVP